MFRARSERVNLARILTLTNDSRSSLKQQMESIYQELTPESIPWNLENPPELVVDLVDSKRILPCETVDLGCGAGNYAVWFASMGFKVTGIDLSTKAIEMAQELSRKKGVTCHFMAEDLTGDLGRFHRSFDFAYDWEVLHHLFPEDREQYVLNVQKLLRPGGRYLSVCFSEEDPSFGGVGKVRKTPIGTELYFSSEEEMRELFTPHFQLDELRTSEITGKYGLHKAIVAWMTRS